MKILIDAQLPPGLSSLLNSICHQACHVAEIGLHDAPDTAIWDYAVRDGSLIFTKDEDFAVRRLRSPAGPTVVWLRVGNCSNSALQRWLMPLLPEIERLVAFGETLIEVR